jgi:DNA-binding transcriptional MerR regulator
MTATLTIGELALQADVAATTLRYYERIGLIQSPARVGGQRPASRALAETKLAEIDTRIAELQRAREIIEWGMRCTCPSIDDCTCGIHTVKPFDMSH